MLPLWKDEIYVAKRYIDLIIMKSIQFTVYIIHMNCYTIKLKNADINITS